MKRLQCFCVAVAATLGGIAVPALAHHSFGATYDVRKDVTLEGTLVQFMFRNPHSFVHIEVADDSGEMQRWSIEWSGTAALQRDGVNRGTLRVGDDVVIIAHPSRTPGEYRGQMVTLSRPLDGLTWGTRPGEVID